MSLRPLLYILLAIFLTSCATTSGYSRLPDQVTEWLEHNVWRVETRERGGTGFWVNDIFVTTCHLVEKSKTALIYNTGRSQLTLTVVTPCDQTISDITTLKPVDSVNNQGGDFKPIPIELVDEMPRPGTLIYSAGWEIGGPLGFVTGVLNRKLDGGFYDAAIYMAPGDSGAPVLALRDNRVELIGLLRAYYSTYASDRAGRVREISILGSSMLLDADSIRAVLEKYQARES